MVERDELIGGSAITSGDALLALASTGPHSNGYSLIRAILERSGAPLNEPITGGGEALSDLLLKPTRIYCSALAQLGARVTSKALSHITGGGITENLPRSIPECFTAVVDTDSWVRPPVFQWLQEQGGVEDREMLRTFNCGVGMVVCLAEEDIGIAIDLLRSQGITAWELGAVEQRPGSDADGIRFL